MSILRRKVPRVFVPFLEPSRYKGGHGGRGSGKSHFFGEHLIDRHCDQRGTYSVCIREVQKSLKQSAKRLLEMKLEKFNLGPAQGWKVYDQVIETPGDGLIIFQGMQDHTAESIKSLEGYDTAWCEEAQTLSQNSLMLLRPTIRNEGSEIWFSWNPRRKTDAVDQFLRQGDIPSDAIVIRANWNHNPWFPGPLEIERQDTLRTEPDQYDHIWEGGYVTVAKGAYFAKHLTLAKAENRITKVPRDPLMVNRVFVDIGGTGAKADAFVMWVAQFVGREIRVLNHYEVVGQELGNHLNWLRSNGYETSNTKIWLPHDGGTHDKVFSVSYESAFSDAGYEVEVVPNQGKGAASMRIEAAKRIFPACWFNESTTEPGREALGWYHEKWDNDRNIGMGPDHDWSSHSSDAFGLMAVVYETPVESSAIPSQPNQRYFG